jgi:hypothetical protein
MTGRRPRSPWACILLAGLLLHATTEGVTAQLLDLSVSPLTITFPRTDPDTVPIVSSAPVQVTYRVRQWSGPWTLTVLAMGDLIAGGSSVDISNVSWVATPAPPFESGRLSKTIAQRLASGTGSLNPARQGQVVFQLANSWNVTAGLYTQTIVFTLSAP